MVTKVKTAARRGRKTKKGSAKKIPLQIPEVKVGEKVRRLRKKNGYSIQKFSELSGVSPAGIYKIEMNQMVPTITTLVKLATALERRTSFFVEEEDLYPASRFICKGDREVIASSQEGRTEIVAKRLRRGCMEATYRTLEPGSKSKNPLVSSGCEHLIYCLRGELGVRLGEESYQLKVGDSFYFESNDGVHFENKGRFETGFLIVNANLSEI
jgi:transcriptional regulator with XRE-family HTH domain